MPKSSLEQLTEPMFYVLMAFRTGSMCGTDISEYVRKHTKNRVKIGPATMYTLLAKFESVGWIEEIDLDQSGRKRTYQLTTEGTSAYSTELKRLRACLLDAQATEQEIAKAAEVDDMNNHVINGSSKGFEERFRNPGLRKQ